MYTFEELEEEIDNPESGLEKLRDYLAKGGRPDIKDSDLTGWSLLHVAARSNNLEAGKLLLETGEINVNIRNSSMETPLHIACFNARYRPCLEMIRFLVKNGADVNAKEEWCHTPLHMACQDNLTEVAEILINEGNPDFNILCPTDGATVLEMARWKENRELINLILDKMEKI